MLSRISNLGGGKCYIESPIWVGGKFYLESNFWSGKFGVESAISNLEFGGGGGKFGGRMLSRISNLGGWKIWGGKCYLESRIWGAENLGEKMLARIFNLGG